MPDKALVKDVSWSSESSDLLAIVDRDGNVYLSDSTGKNLKRIVLSQRCAAWDDIEPMNICWYRGGIILRTTFCQFHYYRNDNVDELYDWRKIWSTKVGTHPYFLTSHPRRNDRVFFVTIEGHVVWMNFFDDPTKVPVFDEKNCVRGDCRFVKFIHPWDDCLAVIDNASKLSIVQADVGIEISRIGFDLEGKIITMLTHPVYPLVAVSTDTGEVAFMNVIDLKNPKMLGKFWMQDKALDLIKFSNTERFVIR